MIDIELDLPYVFKISDKLIQFYFKKTSKSIVDLSTIINIMTGHMNGVSRPGYVFSSITKNIQLGLFTSELNVLGYDTLVVMCKHIEYGCFINEIADNKFYVHLCTVNPREAWTNIALRTRKARKDPHDPDVKGYFGMYTNCCEDAVDIAVKWLARCFDDTPKEYNPPIF